MSLSSLQKELRAVANKERAAISQRFFKTGKGEYGEGDIFLGIRVPDTRTIVLKNLDLNFKEIETLLESKIHEERLAAVLILVEQYNKNQNVRKDIFEFYLDHAKYVNNWDLVDSSADKIVGRFLFGWPDAYQSLLTNLAKSSNIWERRISIVATYYFIKQKQFDHTIRISKILMKDSHDLLQKAVGWMLREMGKRDVQALRTFLDTHAHEMPRTMLRYSLEKFDAPERKKYLKAKI